MDRSNLGNLYPSSISIMPLFETFKLSKKGREDWGIQMVPLLHPDMTEISYGERSVKVIKASLPTGVNPIKDVSMK